MRLRHCLLATSLVAGMVTTSAAQDPNPEPRPERRSWVLVEPHFRRPFLDRYSFRMEPERMRIMERALERSEWARLDARERGRRQVERAEQIRDRARDRALDRLDRVRDHEFAVRNRLSERRNADLHRERLSRERAMERVRERLDQMREDHRYIIRRRSRTI